VFPLPALWVLSQEANSDGYSTHADDYMQNVRAVAEYSTENVLIFRHLQWFGGVLLPKPKVCLRYFYAHAVSCV
jgi:hypothetical protein